MSFLLFFRLTRFFLLRIFHFIKIYINYLKIKNPLIYLILIFLILFSINFLSNFQQKHYFPPLPFCEKNSLNYFYKLYSLSEYPQPDPSPLNWINIKFKLEPSINSISLNLCKINKFNYFSSLFVVVISKLEHFKRRSLLRAQFKDNGITSFIFVLAAANASTNIIEAIHTEANKEQDLLVLANLEENYRLLTYKTRAWLQWLVDNFDEICGPPRFLLKIDDDVMVNWNALSRLLQRAGPSPKKLLFCRAIPKGQISRNPASKWFLSSREYKRNKPRGLGLYCQGMAIVLTRDLLRSALSNTKIMDDWYLTHALLFNTNVTFVDIAPQIQSIDEETKFNIKDVGLSLNVYYTPIFAHFRPAEHFPQTRKLREWKKMLDIKPKSTKTCIL